jgi:hypothetical protein
LLQSPSLPRPLCTCSIFSHHTIISARICQSPFIVIPRRIQNQGLGRQNHCEYSICTWHSDTRRPADLVQRRSGPQIKRRQTEPIVLDSDRLLQSRSAQNSAGEAPKGGVVGCCTRTNFQPLGTSRSSVHTSGRPSITNTRLAHSFPYILKLGRAKYQGLGRHSHCESWTCTWPGWVSCKQRTRRPTPEPSPGSHRVPKPFAGCALSWTIGLFWREGPWTRR